MGMSPSGQSDHRIISGTEIDALLRKFTNIRVYSRNGEPAGHKRYKPLVVLLALGKLMQGQDRISFREVDERLPGLVKKFVHGRHSPRAEQPFWRLRTDKIWEVDAKDRIRTTASGDAFRGDLENHDAAGRFPDDILQALKSNRHSIKILARTILNENFPQYHHQEILDEVGLDEVGLPSESFITGLDGPVRDPEFRQRVLSAYEYRCCICGYDLQVDGQPVGLEAAHIQAFYAYGPNNVQNGLSLCAVHHRAFDCGAFTIQDDGSTIKCSQLISGRSCVEWLTDFHGQRIAYPRSLEDRPKEDHLAWHRKYLFLESDQEAP